MNLTPHFTLNELIFSSTAQRLVIDNTPPSEVIARLVKCATGLEEVRALLGCSMHIDSGYRCHDLNKAIGGATNSAHLEGYAADFTCPEFGTPEAIVKAISLSGIQFDQCIQEGTWVHISFAPAMRHQMLTAHFGANGTTYTKGV
jgi:zinc D-Ala-D-Ala carboxypeptidase